MDRVKKQCILVLAVLLCLALAACQKSVPPPAASSVSPDLSVQSRPAPEPELPPESDPEPIPISPPAPEPPADPEPSSQPEPEPEPEPPREPSIQPSATKLYVLMYHHFIQEGQKYNSWMLTDVRLREDLEWLTEHGYTTILPSQLATGDPLPERAVMLTFDDGYRSNYELAYPLLQEYQAKAVISLIVQYTQEDNPGFLTWDMCREMAQSGLVEFGSHTYSSHDESERGIKRLEGETREDYEARIFPDLQASIDLIEENLGAAPVLFAYPNGVKESWAADFIQAHFAVTVTTRHGQADISKGLYSLKRCNVSMETPLWNILPE